MKYIKVYLIVLLCATIAGCGGHRGHDHDHDHSAESTESAAHDEHDGDGHDNHGDEIFFSDEAAEAAGVETMIVEAGEFRQTIKTSGVISPAIGDESIVVAPAAGVIKFAAKTITQGAPVRAGERIGEIVSKDIAEGDYFAKVRTEYATAEKAYLRGKTLIEDKIISQRDSEALESAYVSAKIAYDALSEKSSGAGVAITSPAAGYIKNTIAAQGEYLSVGDPVMVVTGSRRLQLQADLPQRYFGDLPYITDANFKLPYIDRTFILRELNGRLLAAAKTSADGSAYLPVTFEFDNGGDVVPGAYAEVYLMSKPLENRITVPVDAVMEDQGNFFVYLKVHPEEYIRQEVKRGGTDGQSVEIVAGLEAGDEVVVSGAYQIRLASVSSVIPEGHSH